MSQGRRVKSHFKFSETGALLFTGEQTKRRFALCKESLSNKKSYSVRIKKIYESQIDLEQNCIKKYESELNFTKRYFELYQRAWGGEYFDINKFAAAEGSFFPFVRTRFNSHQPIDEGCIWLGSASAYPLIYVANNIARWVCPYSRGGYVRCEPFLPYAEAKKILPRLINKRIYPDLDFDLF